ncbi:hypothetical protein GCM10022409_31750 [Hymenobacter glaciei]|uniref:DUF3987 domain-containing protein n=1 Tax=Hymenobacter glaciei TaxID=877209 RepID=A0ABP7UHB4_9BACT
MAFFCNEKGVPLADLEAYALDQYAAADFPPREIQRTVCGIYTRERGAHGCKPFAPRDSNVFNTSRPAESPLPESVRLPLTFPPEVYQALPDFLRRACLPFEGHEKAIMLLGTLAVLSGCFPAVGGTYNKRRFGLNLFVFIIAPAASGKSTLAWARRLAWPQHKALTEASRAARQDYEEEVLAYKNAGKAKASLSPPPATPPPYKMLFLPGNTTAAALLTALAENDGRGIICETEADTLSGALGADFGNFSDVLRKAFQHEPVSLLRKTDRQHVDLASPALSIALTGTPGQLPRLMPTAEDGLLSRFLFYVFEQSPTWQDVGPDAGPPLDPYFDRLASEVTDMMAALPAAEENSAYPVEITLSPADWQRLNQAGAAGLNEALALGGGAGGSSAFRLGLIAWRIAGLLTLLRHFERGEALTSGLEAGSVDVGTALAIMDTGRAHALAVLATLAQPASRSGKFEAKAEKEAKARALGAQGLSSRAIAEQTGVHHTTVARWNRE